MPGIGPPPKPDDQRRRKTPPARPWRHAPGHGWQHGAVPEAPHDLTAPAVEAWSTWFSAWYASFWTPQDLPGLRVVVRLYDRVARGEYHRAPELRIQMDTYGITEKGRQALRWQPALEPEARPWEPSTRGRLSARERMRIMQAGEAPPNGTGAA